MVSLLGTQDEFLRLVEKAFPATTIHVRGNEIALAGDPTETARVSRLFEELVLLLGRGQLLDRGMVKQTIRMIRADEAERPSEILSEALITHRGRTIRPKTLGQKRYLDALRENTVTFGIGPAGTGKTYLAMGAAVQALRAKQVNRLILTRPAVEAGERLGFLPGTLHEKIDPYLKPLWDALMDMMEAEELAAHVERGTIEVAPLAYMRGRAQPVSAQVLTPSGFRAIGDLVPGDHVIGSDGRPTEVLGTFPQGENDIYRLSSQDGASTRCTADHLWSVTTASDRRRGRPARVLESREMIGKLRAAHAHRYELPLLSRPVEFEPREVPMDPYALGLLLGDGCLTGSTTSSFATTTTSLGGTASVALAPTLRDDRGVPGDYLLNAPDVRLAVLQGILDGGGEVAPGRRQRGRIRYVASDAQLGDDVRFLVASLGGTATVRDALVLDLRLPAGVEPFRLGRKLRTYQQHGGGRPARFITSIEPDGREEAVCIRVAAADSLYVTEDLLVTHNTLNDAFIVLDEAQNTTAEQMKMFLTRIGFNSKAVVTGDVSQVDLPSGKRSGLKVVREILGDIEGVAFAELTSGDVVRHHIVQRIVEAYELHQAAEDEAEAARAAARDAARDGDR
ncbi:PhoH family protein [Nitriliruptor sp.]|uniref:PhoH family protein n=1 Tax=Nitriliruptor sp. TaxID=2448056 RepID=UPI00349FFF86